MSRYRRRGGRFRNEIDQRKNTSEGIFTKFATGGKVGIDGINFVDKSHERELVNSGLLDFRFNYIDEGTSTDSGLMADVNLFQRRPSEDGNIISKFWKNSTRNPYERVMVNPKAMEKFTYTLDSDELIGKPAVRAFLSDEKGLSEEAIAQILGEEIAGQKTNNPIQNTLDYLESVRENASTFRGPIIKDKDVFKYLSPKDKIKLAKSNDHLFVKTDRNLRIINGTEMYPEEPVGNPLYLERKGHNQWKNVAKSDTQSTLWKEGIGQDLKKIDFWHESAGLERTLIQGLTKEEYHKYMTEGTEFMNKDEIDKVSNLFRKHGEKTGLYQGESADEIMESAFRDAHSYGRDRTGMLIPEDVASIWKDKGVTFGDGYDSLAGKTTQEYLSNGVFHRKALLSIGEGGKYHGKYLNAYSSGDKDKIKEVMRIAYEDMLKESRGYGDYLGKLEEGAEYHTKEQWNNVVDHFTDEGLKMTDGFVPESLNEFLRNIKFDYNDDSLGPNYTIDARHSKLRGGQGYGDFMDMHEDYFINPETGSPNRIFGGSDANIGEDFTGKVFYDAPQYEGQKTGIIFNGKKYYNYTEPIVENNPVNTVINEGKDLIQKAENVAGLGDEAAAGAGELITAGSEVIEKGTEKVAEKVFESGMEEVLGEGVGAGLGEVGKGLGKAAGAAIGVGTGVMQMGKGIEEGRPGEVIHGAIHAASPWLAAAGPAGWAVIGVNTVWDLLDG